MRKILFSLFVLSQIVSCSLFDSAAPEPAFLIVDEVSIQTTNSQGAPTHNIRDVWVYADGQLLGTFEIPAMIPVIPNGSTTEFQIFPGIRNNGEISRSFIYRFMDIKIFTEELQPGETINKSFTFEYNDNVKFDFVEGFESNHIFTFDMDGNEETFIKTTGSVKKSGERSGLIEISPEYPELGAATIINFDGANNAGSDSYLELDYYNEEPLLVGVIYIEDNIEYTQPIIVLNTTTDWNKIYIDYTNFLASPAITNYRIFFSAVNNSLDGSKKIYIDNVKFLHL